MAFPTCSFRICRFNQSLMVNIEHHSGLLESTNAKPQMGADCIFTEKKKKSAYKWTCPIQTHIVQGQLYRQYILAITPEHFTSLLQGNRKHYLLFFLDIYEYPCIFLKKMCYFLQLFKRINTIFSIIF